MSRFGTCRDSLGPSPHRVLRIAVAAMFVTSLAACATVSGSPSQAAPTSSPTSAPATLSLPLASSPTAVPASADPTGLRWLQGGMPGVPAATDPNLNQEFHVLGWSKGYLGFTSTFVKATGREQSLVVTSSADGRTWRTAGRLDLGSDHEAITVTQLVEGPAGLIATAERVGCALHKPAVRMWRSTDGDTWTPVDLKGVFGADALSGVSGGSAGYVVLAATSKERTLWTSQDGASWHKRAVPSPAFSPQSVASFQRGFVVAGRTQVASIDCGATTGGTAVHYTGSVWLSQQGSSWVEAELPDVLDGTQTTMSAYQLNDTTVLVEELASDEAAPDGARRDWTSSDGLTWQQNDALAASLGYPLSDGTRTTFLGSSNQGEPEIWALTHDLRVVNLAAGADAPIASQDGLVALGPAGLVVTDSSGAISWLAVPVQ